MTKEKQFARAKAIAMLECMAIDLTGSLAGLKEANPMSDVLNQKLDAIDVAQEALREQPRWISVDERLPDVNQRVLVWCESRMRTKHITVSTYMSTYSGTRRTFFSRRVRKVTHWMPLPEPPKVEV